MLGLEINLTDLAVTSPPVFVPSPPAGSVLLLDADALAPTETLPMIEDDRAMLIEDI